MTLFLLDCTDLMDGKDIVKNCGEAYDWTLWDSTIENTTSPLEEDWRAHMGANTTMEYVQNNNILMVAPGSDYTTPEEESVSGIHFAQKFTVKC